MTPEAARTEALKYVELAKGSTYSNEDIDETVADPEAFEPRIHDLFVRCSAAEHHILYALRVLDCVPREELHDRIYELLNWSNYQRRRLLHGDPPIWHP
jgi:hypothetical protein